MIIDKVEPYYTEEDLAHLTAIEGESYRLYKSLRREEKLSKENRDIIEKIQQLDKDANNIKWEVENRYIKDRKGKGLLADVREIVEAVTKKDFLARIQSQKDQLDILRKEGIQEEDLTLLKEYTKENYDNAYHYILYFLRVQLNGLHALGEAEEEKALAIVEKRAGQWYARPTPAHLAIPYSRPTDALAYMSQKSAKIDNISGDATIDRFSVQITIAKFRELKASLGISTDKLLSTALAVFARNNDFSKKAKEAKNRRVVIPLREYAKLLGYDVEERETHTPEEAKEEKRRVKTALDNARKKVRKDLDILYNLSFEWEERLHGKLESFSSVRLLTAKEYRGGNISITFTPEIADHLIERGLITQYNTRLLSWDERNPNPYYIMRKIEEYYNMDANQARGTHDRISIPALLAVTDLPSYEEVQRTDRGHWERRIKEPLEEALDSLTKEGILKSWEYTHAKGVPLTEEEAYSITSYPEYEKLYLLFTPADKVDHTERQEKRRQEREAKKKRKRKS